MSAEAPEVEPTPAAVPESPPPAPRHVRRWHDVLLPMLPSLGVLIAVGIGATTYRAQLMAWFSGSPPPAAAPSPHAGHVSDAHEATADPERIVHYTCPMHPAVKAPAPGQCPFCGMDLVPVKQGELATGTILVDDLRRQRIGVVTAKVGRATVTARVVAPGMTTFAEDGQVDVLARATGWIDRLHVGAVGDRVKAGEPLVEITSPEVRAAVAEYLAVLRTTRGEAPLPGTAQLARASRDRLLLLGLPEDEVKALVKAGRAAATLVLRAPFDAVVLKKEVVQGSPVGMGMALMRLARTDPLWIDARVYEPDAAIVRGLVGSTVRVRFPIAEMSSVEGSVTLIAPTLDPETRSLGVRIQVPNPDGALFAGLTAVVVFERTLEDQLVVPADAVIFAGARRLVFVDLGEGRLRPVSITTGIRDNDQMTVLDGLTEGTTIVTSGLFLLSAESRLRTAGGEGSPW